MRNLLSGGLIFLIRVYQCLISPSMPAGCRFYPTCSAYTLEAVNRYGACSGLWMGLRRLLKCHPWHEGGVDPVAPPSKLNDARQRKRELSCP